MNADKHYLHVIQFTYPRNNVNYLFLTRASMNACIEVGDDNIVPILELIFATHMSHLLVLQLIFFSLTFDTSEI